MADQTSEPGAGNVPILLDGEELTLKPSLETCMRLSQLANNSLEQAVHRCLRFDFEFICEVISLGLDATSPALRKDVRDKVYRTGVINLAATAGLFIRVIMNGGRRPSVAQLALNAAAELANVAKGEKEFEELMPSILALLESIRQIAEVEAGEDRADPLAESESSLENSTAA